jgi:class 3 adenylate cyclase
VSPESRNEITITRPALRHGERRHATVLFSDMKGFTALTQGRDPEDIDRLMSSLFARFEGIVRRRGGSVEKYIGDAMVAVFGVPRLHEDDAIRAVQAAWEFRRELMESHPDLTFRTGIHSGLITTGKRGTHDVVTGHALAVASRLETAAEPGGILVSEAVYDVARRAFSFGDELAIRAKGREEPVRARAVSGVRKLPVHHDELFVGRDDLLKDLMKLYLRSAGGSSAAVVLHAEPGMGTSEVAHRFAKEAREFPRFDGAIVVVRPIPFCRSPYSGIWSAVRERLGADDSSTDADIRDAVSRLSPGQVSDPERAAAFVASGGADDDPARLYPVVGELLSSLFETASGVFPPVFIIDTIDDLSADERDLFRFLVNRAVIAGFFVATSKDASGDAAAILPNAVFMEVPPLTLEETARLIMELKGGTPDEDFVSDVHERTGGNPTFVRELFRYFETNPSTDEIPVAIQTVVITGTQTLPESCQELLRRLSVLDHVFRYQDAEALADDAWQPEALEELIAHRYLKNQGNRFAFANEIVRKSIYDSLLNHNKQVLHASAGELVADDDLPPVVRVGHLVRSGQLEKAAAVIRDLRGRVVNNDRRLLEPIDAILQRSRKLDDDMLGELLYLRLAIMFNTHAPDEEVAGSIRQLLELGVRTRRSELMGRAYAFLIGRHHRRGALHAARQAGFQALRHYERGKSVERTDSVKERLSVTCRRLGRLDEADAMADAVENQSMRLSLKAENAMMHQDLVQARSLIEEGVALAETADEPPQIARLWRAVRIGQLARVYIAASAWPELLTAQDDIEGIVGPWYSDLSKSYSGLAMAAHNLGRHDEAASFLERAAYLSRQSANEHYWYSAPCFLAMARIELGQGKQALSDLERIYVDLANEPYEEVIIAVLQLMLRALGTNDAERSCFYLSELEAMLEYMPVAWEYNRMFVAWYRYALGESGCDASSEGADRTAALEEAHSLATAIIERQGDSPFSGSIRQGHPYREILEAWELRHDGR